MAFPEGKGFSSAFFSYPTAVLGIPGHPKWNSISDFRELSLILSSCQGIGSSIFELGLGIFKCSFPFPFPRKHCCPWCPLPDPWIMLRHGKLRKIQRLYCTGRDPGADFSRTEGKGYGMCHSQIPVSSQPWTCSLSCLAGAGI